MLLIAQRALGLNEIKNIQKIFTCYKRQPINNFKSIKNDYYETQKLFLNGDEVEYTTNLKIIDRFEFFLKNVNDKK